MFTVTLILRAYATEFKETGSQSFSDLQMGSSGLKKGGKQQQYWVS